VYYSANYYDAADRVTDSVNFGTNGGTALLSRPSLGSLPPGALHTTYAYQYGSSGHEDIVTDPRGIQTETLYDLLGRSKEAVAVHTSGTPASIDQTTDYTYDGENHVLGQNALVGSAHQTTQYVYGYTGSTSGYTLHSNDIEL